MHEAQLYDEKVFVTLTYNDDHLPIDGGLVKRHFQLFMKRLRKSRADQIRFFHCGEYGDENLRPHYHAIIFNTFFPDQRRHSLGSDGDQLYVSEELDRLWGMGNCYIGSVTAQSCGYVARYALKKINGEMAPEHYRRVDLETGEVFQVIPEYITMSQGIGKGWYEKFSKEVHESDSVIVRGREQLPPRYYDRKLEAVDPKRAARIKRKRIARASTRASRQNSTSERLAVRRVVKEAQISTLKRNLK